MHLISDWLNEKRQVSEGQRKLGNPRQSVSRGVGLGREAQRHRSLGVLLLRDPAQAQVRLSVPARREASVHAGGAADLEAADPSGGSRGHRSRCEAALRVRPADAVFSHTYWASCA